VFEQNKGREEEEEEEKGNSELGKERLHSDERKASISLEVSKKSNILYWSAACLLKSFEGKGEQRWIRLFARNKSPICKKDIPFPSSLSLSRSGFSP
jgi:hypothetical protein